ncbi:uracil-DNA glycosylase family protein [candidate division CSSED10-310 bacterium]|uniref:Type-4 uracil-DNA glycosylase n=1 Tax=candidate division CSSED10-310 bacterium TaxID=2855610 RepID=A0ABV6YXJ7_UNCC1
MTNYQRELIDIVRATRSHLCQLLDDRVDYLSGLEQTFFTSPTPAMKRALLAKEELRLTKCSLCKLSQNRKKLVYGEGNPAANLMFIGEGPGEMEDETGRPFVGPAGQLLDKIIEAMGLARSDVYIANIVKCRPPANRDPETDEIQTCQPFLDTQIALIQPKIIVTLGAPATRTLLNTSTTIGKLRGNYHHYKGIPVLPTYHPSYLLRTPARKRETWQDVQKVMQFLKQRAERQDQ